MMAELKKAHNETPWWARTAVLALFAAIAFGAIVTLDFTDEVKDYGRQNRANAILTCEQGNQNRVADIENLRGDIARLKGYVAAEQADIAGLQRSGVSDAAWINAHGRNLVGIERNIVQKQNAIKDKLASIEPFAVAPGSPVKDCERANPPSRAGTSPIPFVD